MSVRLGARQAGTREASGIRDEFKVTEHGRYSTDGHLNHFLSGSGYSISAVRFRCFIVLNVFGKVAYESLLRSQFWSGQLDIRANHARVFPSSVNQA